VKVIDGAAPCRQPRPAISLRQTESNIRQISIPQRKCGPGLDLVILPDVELVTGSKVDGAFRPHRDEKKAKGYLILVGQSIPAGEADPDLSQPA